MAGFLQCRAVSKSFGAVAAVVEVSLEVSKGDLHSIIGPNGAGKTTLFNCISGEVAPSSGRIVFDGADITGLAPHKLPARGISRSFQRTSIFDNLTVAQNVWVSAHAKGGGDKLDLLSDADARVDVRDLIMSALVEVGLADQADKKAGQLGHGDQRLLDFAITLAPQPKLLLLDEPTAGLSKRDTQRVIEHIDQLKGRFTIVLIEHKMDVVMTVSDRVSVMYFGKVLTEGTPDEVRADSRVREAYLGRRA